MDPVKCPACGQTNRPMKVVLPGLGVSYQCGNVFGCTEILDVEGERPGASEPSGEVATEASAPMIQVAAAAALQAPGALTGASIVEATLARLAVVRDRLTALRAELRTLTEEEAMLERIAAVAAPPSVTQIPPEARPS